MQKNIFTIPETEKATLREVYAHLGIGESESEFVLKMYKNMKELRKECRGKEYYNLIREQIIVNQKFQTLFFVCLSRANSCWPWTLFRRALGIGDDQNRSIFKTFEMIVNRSVEMMLDDYIFAECITIYLIHTTKEMWEFLALEFRDMSTEGTAEETMKEHISVTP